MRFSILLFLFAFMFTGCNGPSEPGIQDQPEPAPSITSADLAGDWELARWTVQDEGEDTDHDMALPDLKIWTFAEDSIAVTCYPYYLFNYKPYKIVGDSLYYSWDGGADFKDKYHLAFKGDTLLMTSMVSLIMGGKLSPGDTSRTLFRNYLVRISADQDTLSRVKTDLVDWTFYQQKWNYVSGMCIEPFDMPTADSIAVPINLDLTPKNISHYTFTKEKLNYFDTKTKRWYTFDFRGHGYKNDTLSTLLLAIYSSDSSQRNSIRYNRAK